MRKVSSVSCSIDNLSFILAAYFTQATIDQLGTIDENPLVRDLNIPDGMFKSTRVGKSRTKTDDGNRSDAARAATAVPRTYAPFLTPYQYQAQNGSPSMTPVLMHEPYRTSRVEEPSPSPDSFQDQGNYGIHQRPYSTLNNTSTSASTSASTSYADRVYSPIPLTASQPSNDLSRYSVPGMRFGDRQTRTSPRSSPPWEESGDSYYPRSRYQDGQRHEITPQYPTSSPSSCMAPVEYHSHPVTSPQAYMSPGTPLPHLSTNDGSRVYLPSSNSLYSALTLPSQNNDAHESYTLSPLQIPGRMHSNVYSPSRSSEMQQIHGEELPPEDADHEGSLAPLDVLRRPSRFRRDPMDEKTLRLLREKRSSP